MQFLDPDTEKALYATSLRGFPLIYDWIAVWLARARRTQAG